ncbi:hypothetical protein PGB90_006085 [Kerria lacca]
MAATAPMRDGPPAGSGTGGDSRVTTTSASSAAAATTTNFEYDESEWDIGIGNLIIDLDADIEKTNEKSNVGNLISSSSNSMAAASATNAASSGSSSSSKSSKSSNSSSGSGTTNSGSSSQSSTVEHSSTVDNKGLKMKIKRTKSGSKSSEKHEIVKPNEQNGGEAALCNNSNDVKGSTSKHSMSGSAASVNSNVNSTNISANTSSNCGSVSTNVNNVSNKRGGSSHRRDKTKDKHPQSGDKAVSKSSTLTNQSSASQVATLSGNSSNSISTPDLNGIVRTSVQRMFPMQTNGPGLPNAPGPPASPSKDPSLKQTSSAFNSNSIPATCGTQQTSSAQVTATSVSTNANASASLNQSSVASTSVSSNISSVNNSVENVSSAVISTSTGSNANMSSTNVYATTMDEALPRPQSPSSPPCKKIKTANCLINDKETKDACVGTSISTMTEPDCLGPCEPGTSVTLEGIVWHETEGVLVVNVTWRGKTYVGTLLDCTRHDWAPPRFCDSPTSDLDTRLPKGRAKRGRAATDLSNFTETRSSVHSKLRSSSNGSNKNARKGLSNSPTPFVPPRPDSGSGKRKNRPSEEESASPQANGKKNKPMNQTTSVSPPSSPVFFECPEANCCKKYKHMNGLKYHQSHAHGGTCNGDDDDATKESGSMSETEELPSPVDQQSIKSERKDENSESEPATPISESVSTSLNHPSSPHSQSTPMNLISEMEPPVAVEPSPPPIDNKTINVGVLRYGVPVGGIEEINMPQTTTSTVCKTSLTTNAAGIRPVTTPISTLSSNLPLTISSSTVSQPHSLTSPSSPSISQQIPLSPSQSASSGIVPLPFSAAQQLQQTSAVQSLPLNPTVSPKLPQFKVKPASVLLQDDKMKDKSKIQVPRKKNRKSPGDSPHSHMTEQSQYKQDPPSNREELRSPAYSDISDDGAPVLEAEVSDTKKPLPMDKKSLDSNGSQSPHAMPHYNNIYSFYGQPPFLVPSVQPESKSKDDKGQENKINLSEKEKKDNEIPQKLLPSHYYPFDYVPSYSYNLGPNYPIPMVASNNGEKEIKDENNKSPGPTDLVKQPSSSMLVSQNVNQYSSSVNKNKLETQAKIQNEPYSNIKDNSEARSPLNSSSFLHTRQQQQQLQLQQQQLQQQQQQLQQQQQMQQHMQQHQQQQSSLHHAQSQQQMQQQMLQQQAQHHLSQSHQSHEDVRRYFGSMYPDQRRKDQHTSHPETPLKATPPPNSLSSKTNMSSSSSKHKDKQLSEEKKEEKLKQEGVKPTMETQGPPPPPTSSYAYFPSTYLPSPHYGTIPFEQAHPMYRGMSPMIVPTGHYGNSHYLHHPAQIHSQIPRYHAPEDLSRPPSGSATKALDMLHHQASQYYPSSHKIHELQERAIKSPTPKVSTTNSSPSAAPNGQQGSLNPPQLTPTSTSDRLSATGSMQNTKASSIDGKDSRSPPPQRHVHTHHHTHVGIGYPILPGQYPAPYQAAVLASEQAAGVTSTGSNPYSPK